LTRSHQSTKYRQGASLFDRHPPHFWIAVYILVFGPGLFSLDWIIGKIYAKRTSAAAQKPPVQ